MSYLLAFFVCDVICCDVTVYGVGRFVADGEADGLRGDVLRVGGEGEK